MKTQLVFGAPRDKYCSLQLTNAAGRQRTPRHDTVRTKILQCLRLGLGSAFALVAGGCATGKLVSTDASSRVAAVALQSQREVKLQSTWRGRPYEALVETYGEPKMTMSILGYRPLKTSLVVYGVVDQTANCVDAFTMVKHAQTGNWTVAEYFCR